MKKIGIFLFLFCLITPCVFSKDLCDSPVRQDLIKCMSDELNKNEASLDEAYEKIISKTTKLGMKKEKQKFVNSQKMWIKMRDHYCSLYQDFFEGGAEMPIHHLGCLADLTGHRADELKGAVVELLDPLAD